MTLKEIPVEAKVVLGLIAAIVGLIVLFVFNPFYKIDSSERGLVLTWGKVGEQVVQPGLHVRVPVMQKVEQVKIVPQSIDIVIPVDATGAISNDNQTLGLDASVYYRFNEDRLVEMRKDWGRFKVEEMINSSLIESVKEVVGKYDIFSLAMNQEEIRSKVAEMMRAKTVTYPVTITDLRILNWDWSDAFDSQIAATMKKAQEVKQAEQELLLVQQQAQKQVTESKAAAEALVAKAEGEKTAAALSAEAKKLEGQGIADYNSLVAKNMDLEITLKKLDIELEKAKHFNGVYVPSNVFVPWGSPLPTMTQ